MAITFEDNVSGKRPCSDTSPRNDKALALRAMVVLGLAIGSGMVRRQMALTSTTMTYRLSG